MTQLIKLVLMRRGSTTLVLAFLAAAGATFLSTSLPTYAQMDSPLFLPFVGNGQEPAGNEDVIEGRYIVVLHEASASALSAADHANMLLAYYGGTVIHTYDSALYGFAAELSPEAATALQHNPAVDYVEPDQRITIDQVSISTVQTGATWGLDRIDQRNLPLDSNYNYTMTGAGVHVYVIDNGIYSAHVEFQGRLGNGFTTIADGNGAQTCPDPSSNTAGHGTHVAGTIGGTTYGVAKQVTLHSVRTLKCDGNGLVSDVIAGVNWVTANHSKPAVANMSLGGGISTALDQAVLNAVASGITFVAAAGNSGTNACDASPARLPEAITVGATNTQDSRASFSNWGPCLDLFAPGAGITSAWHSGITDSRQLNGTSMASPHVAGAVALYLERFPQASPVQVTLALLGATTTGQVSNLGINSPNRLLYVTSLQGNEMSPPTEPSPSPSPVTPLPTPATPTPTPVTPTPTPTPEPNVCQEVVTNGAFEAGSEAWTQTSSQGFRLICTQATCGAGLQPYQGSWLAWLGGGNNERSRLSQTVTIPAGRPAVLTYRHWIESEDQCGHDDGFVQVVADNALSTLKQYSLCSDERTGGWMDETIDLGAYVGKTVLVEFYVANDNSMISSLLIDDVSLQSGSTCPVQETVSGQASSAQPTSGDAAGGSWTAEAPLIPRNEEIPAGDPVWTR